MGQHDPYDPPNMALPDLDYDLSIRTVALKAAAHSASGTNHGTTTENVLNRAKKFEEYLRGDS